MEPWIFKHPALPDVLMTDTKIYYQYHRTAQYPEEGVDFIRSHVVDYGKDPAVISRRIQADYDWYNEHREELYEKYGRTWLAINNQRIICYDGSDENLDYELEDVLPRTSYLSILCTQRGSYPLIAMIPSGIDIDMKE